MELVERDDVTTSENETDGAGAVVERRWDREEDLDRAFMRCAARFAFASARASSACVAGSPRTPVATLALMLIGTVHLQFAGR